MPCQKGTMQPRPISAVASTDGTHVMSGFEVQPNQNSPAGKATAPMIIGGRRSSGIALPYLL